ncbi:hypothetical protein [Glycomyces salinus]|uniref:hypothetical protein n=1 Tax=Glycomyces salinus TaxID=980294 RepID=UPI0018EB5F70|nr:hypothetical protein [Glycomyces salinus]
MAASQAGTSGVPSEGHHKKITIPGNQQGLPFDEHVEQSMAVANSAALEAFDFEGLDESAIILHPEHGPCFMSERLIRWAGWSSPSDVRRDHLQPGDEVEISTSIKRGRGTTTAKVKFLTKRGARRLLMRSNHSRAIAYADRVLDMLDELDQHGMVVDEQRITDDQIQAGRERLDAIAKARLEERMDYKFVLDSIKAGGATESLDYARVQNALYLELFGATAKQIIKTRPQLTGKPKKRGEGFCKSVVAKDYLTEAEIRRMQGVVLNVVSQLHVLRPNGATAEEIIAMVEHAVSFLERRGAA